MLINETLQGVPAAERFEFFHSQVSEIFCPMSCERSVNCQGDFSAGILSQQLGNLGFSAVKSSPLDVYRRHTDISAATDSMYLVKVQVEGQGLVQQKGREAHLTPGDFTLCLSSEPYELHFEESYAQVVLSVPQSLLDECVHQPSQHLGVRMDSCVGANGLFSQFVTSIAGRLDTMDGVLAQRLEANVIDLLATTLGYAQEAQKRNLLNAGVKSEYIQRIKHFIRRNLDDERLGPEWIASAHQISTRYLHMLFEGESVSISRYIQQLRLESCRAALEDPSFARYSVSDIAYRFGFKDASHFSRSFKSEFGETPARYRRAIGS
jgi:AraC-like DNA-binding protein